MDAETRHQLKQNELAEALAKLRTFSDKRLRIALIVVAGILVLFLAYRWWRASASASRASAWTAIWQAEDTSGDLAKAVDNLRAQVAAQSDPVLAGGARLRLGITLVARARESGADREKLLREALEVLKPVTTLDGPGAQFAATALFQTAAIHEALRDIPAARSAYETLTTDKRFEASPYRDLAASLLATVADLLKPVYFVPGDKPVDAVPTGTPAPPAGAAPQLPPGVQIVPSPATPPKP